jgi:hypothetical protein
MKPVIQNSINNLITKWKGNATEGIPINLSEDLSLMANENIMNVLFGRHLKPESSAKFVFSYSLQLNP